MFVAAPIKLKVEVREDEKSSILWSPIETLPLFEFAYRKMLSFVLAKSSVGSRRTRRRSKWLRD